MTSREIQTSEDYKKYMVHTNRVLPMLEEDQRLVGMINNLDKRYFDLSLTLLEVLLLKPCIMSSI